MKVLTNIFTFICITTLFLSGISGCQREDEETGVLKVDTLEPVKFSSAEPKSGSTIQLNTEIVITFNEEPENVSVSKGSIASKSGNRITIKGPFDPGELVLEVKWKGGSKTLSYEVEGAVFSSVSPGEGNTINPFTDITVRFNGRPENVKVSHGTTNVSGSTVTIKGPLFVVGRIPLIIEWKGGSKVLNYVIDDAPVAKIEQVWTDHNVFENGEKGMRIHVEFHAWHMQFQDGRVIAYFSFRDGAPLKDFNGKFKTENGNVSASKNFTPGHFRSTYHDFDFFMPYSELHFNKDGKWDLRFKVRVVNRDLGEFIEDESVYKNFTYTKG